MKIKDLLFKYKNEYDRLQKIADDYKKTHYCGYMGEWINGSEEKYEKLKQDIKNYLDSEV